MPDSGSSISPQSIFCLVLRLMYPAVAHGRCTTDPNTLEAACSCHLLISPVKQATGSHAPFPGPGQGARTFPLESYVSAHCGIFVPEGELPAPITGFPNNLFSLVGNGVSFLLPLSRICGRKGRFSLLLSFFWRSSFSLSLGL